MTADGKTPRRTINEVLGAYQRNGENLSVSILPDEDGNTEFDDVLIEGDSQALKFLSEILAAMADGEPNDGFELHPRGPGSIYFNASSPLGLYIHRRDGGK